MLVKFFCIFGTADEAEITKIVEVLPKLIIVERFQL
jgi:hypothetical protein